jgi:hypothetical protein
MRTRTILASLVVFLGGLAIGYAADTNPHMGTWKLNEAKSNFMAGATKNNTVMYEAAGDSVKVTVDGTDKDGKAVHSEWTGKFDGKDYPATGDPAEDMRSYKVVNPHTLDFAVKKGGKVVVSGRVIVAPDGKSRTVRTSGPTGKNLAFYDKQ